ncbi:MAG: hypothetical protein HC923_05920, partial [Myxococcales bacterium]|nr:hypothetical protein [Myxococcales bacterium]
RDGGDRAPRSCASCRGPATSATPALDFAGNIYVVTENGILVSWDFDGEERYRLALPTDGKLLDAPSVAVGANELTIVVGADRVFGVENRTPPSISAWFRYRRDNFSTAHR